MSEKLENLSISFLQSLEDQILSRKERKSLKSQIQENQLSDRERQVLRSEVKKLALEKMDSNNGSLVIEWMYEAFKVLAIKNEASAKNKVLFSPGTECREAICSLIRLARSSIRICVFTISDNDIRDEILIAHQLGKKVEIITDNEKQFDMGSDIREMEDAGIATVVDQTSAHMHHKFALFDNDTVLTGSYNWTRSAATQNHENIIIIKDHSTFREYEREFTNLWKELS